MSVNPYAPGTRSHAVAQHILDAHAAGRWVTTAELCRRTGAKVRLVDAVRGRLREEGLAARKGDYATCHICGAKAIARDLCSRHYQSRVYRAALALLILALASPAAARDVRPPPGASWWLTTNPPPAVEIVGGEGGVDCQEGATVCTVWAQGAWGRVAIGGETVGARLWLPGVSR